MFVKALWISKLSMLSQRGINEKLHLKPFLYSPLDYSHSALIAVL